MDLRVVYNGAWLQKVNDLGYAGTLHVTGQLYASLTVSFYGSGITVLGYVPLGIAPVTVRYTIDGDASTTQDRQVGGSAILVVDQPFYAASGLPLQQHNLTMNVTSGVPTRLFGYDCFVVDKSVGGASDNVLVANVLHERTCRIKAFHVRGPNSGNGSRECGRDFAHHNLRFPLLLQEKEEYTSTGHGSPAFAPIRRKNQYVPDTFVKLWRN